MTKRIRVTRELPFAQVGEEFEKTEYYCMLNGWQIPEHDLEKWIKDGWFELVEEEKSIAPQKSLGEEFHRVSFLTNEEMAELAKIAKEHYEKKFDEAVSKSFYDKNIHEYDNNIRKAMFGGEK